MAGGMFDDLIPAAGKSAPAAGIFDDLIPKASDAGPVQAAEDIGRMMLKGAAMGKEATPEDAADRANAIRQSIGRKVLRGRMPEAAPVTPEQYRPFFEEQQREQKAAAERAGGAGTAAEILGAVAGGGKVAEGINLVTGIARGLPMVGGLISNPWAGAAATGGILGASGAQGTDQNKLLAAGIGAGAGVAGQAVGNAILGGVNKAAGAFNMKPAIPTREGIEAAKKAAYAEAEKAGVVFTPQFSQRIRAEIEPQLARMGYDPALQPKIAPVLSRIEQAGKENVTLPGVEVLRKVAGNAYEPGNKASNAMMRRIVEALDNRIGSPGPGEVIMGDAASGARALQSARKYAHIDFKLETVLRQMARAENQAMATNSGGNIQNATRQSLKSLLNNESKTRGFTADEMEALKTAVRGTAGQNLTRWAGNAIPSAGLGALASGSAGALALGPLGVALPAVGYGLKKTSDKIADRNIQQLVKILAAGGSRAATKAPDNAVQRLTKAQRELILRAFGIGGAVSLPALAQ